MTDPFNRRWSKEGEIMTYDPPPTMGEYQRDASRTMREVDRDNPISLSNWALGLCGEAGEFGELVKKHVYHGHVLDRERAAKELGDVLWYVAAACTTLGLDMGDVAAANLEKLRARFPAGFTTAASVARVDVK